jgi:hypothetical protein
METLLLVWVGPLVRLGKCLAHSWTEWLNLCKLDHLLRLIYRQWWIISRRLRLGQFATSRVLRR